MKTHKLCLTLLSLFVAVLLVGCHGTAGKSEDVPRVVESSQRRLG
jgi:outer membrane biogenesis lipoprotein LolB